MGKGKAVFGGPEGAAGFERLLAGVELDGMALVEQSLDAPPAIGGSGKTAPRPGRLDPISLTNMTP